MTRIALTLLVFVASLSPALASLSPSRDSLPFNGFLSRKEAIKEPAKPSVAPASSEPKFLLTDETEILLDGQPCRYQDVPPGASIVKLDVAADKRTILSIHFRSKK